MESAVKNKLISRRSLKRRIDTLSQNNGKTSNINSPVESDANVEGGNFHVLNYSPVTQRNESNPKSCQHIPMQCDDHQIDSFLPAPSNEQNDLTPTTSQAKQFHDTNSQQTIVINDDYDFLEDYVWSGSEDEGDTSDYAQNVEPNESIELNWSEGLSAIAIKHNLTLAAVTDLLKLFHQKGITEVPKDARTLLKTPKQAEIKIVPPGEYVHFSLKDKISIIVSKFQLYPEVIKISFNIDGLPISRSSKGQFWPILAHLDNFEFRPFVVGIYYGHAKPFCASEYLKYFIDDLKVLLDEGITVDERTMKLEINNFVCDAPARAFIKGTKGHNGYFACERCQIEGEYSYISHTVCFYEDHDCLARTDESFRSRRQPEHHISTSLVEELPIDMVNSFPLDYLHLILLGITKKLIHFWMEGNRSYKIKLSANDISRISARIVFAGLSLPKEFSRAVRTLDLLCYFKGTELRTFLLYTGVVVLENILPQEAYSHFLLLHCAVTICVSEHHFIYLEIAEKLFELFYNDMIIYGVEYTSFNFHNVKHLIADVKKNGPLDKQSAFRYESELCKIKRLVRSGNKPLQQIANRLSEQFNSYTTKINSDIFKPI